jgi:hypothetical protein
MKRISNDRVAAIPACGAEVVQPFQMAAFAFPVTDGKIHERQFGNVAEIRDRENRLKNGLQTAVISLAGQLVHLQEAIIGTLLHLNEVWDL